MTREGARSSRHQSLRAHARWSICWIAFWRFPRPAVGPHSSHWLRLLALLVRCVEFTSSRRREYKCTSCTSIRRSMLRPNCRFGKTCTPSLVCHFVAFVRGGSLIGALSSATGSCFTVKALLAEGLTEAQMLERLSEEKASPPVPPRGAAADGEYDAPIEAALLR